MVDGFTDWLTRFDYHLRAERRLARLTRQHYRRDLEGFAGFCRKCGLADWAAVTVGDVRAYVAARHRAGLDGRSLQRLLSSIRALYRFLLREGFVGSDPAADIQAPKAARRLPDTLDADETARLLDEHGAADALARRDLAMFELTYSSGLRLAELAALDVTALGDVPTELRIEGKGAKIRVAPVGRLAREALARWMEVRAQLAAASQTALFVARSGRRLSHRAIQNRLAVLSQRRGLGRPVHPHMLRHACASHVLESSGDLRAVQELLGHADIATTQIYTHLNFQHLASVYDKAHPRARRRKA